MREVTVGESVLEITPTGDSMSAASQKYIVKLKSGEWPNNDQVLDACGDHPFGGFVHKDGALAKVTCWLD